MITPEEYEQLKKRGAREIPFKDITDVGEAFSNLDSNTHIDKNTRLDEPQVAALSTIAGILSADICPFFAGIIQPYLRYKVSEGGKGRAEKVKIVTGIKDQKKPSNWQEWLKPQPKDKGMVNKDES